MEGLIENGSMTPAIGRLLEIASRARLNVLVSGGTGSGKTTLLNAMSQFIDHTEREKEVELAVVLAAGIADLRDRPDAAEGDSSGTALTALADEDHAERRGRLETVPDERATAVLEDLERERDAGTEDRVEREQRQVHSGRV
jgi:energy-coupling factor transporter ATP-binding protein EcfA2